MIGVILMSHGLMAEGTLDTLKMFFGENIPQIKALCFKGSDLPEEFDAKLKEAIEELDDGHGVIGFADLMGGTPCNRSAMQLSDRFYVIPGMNLAMIMELLGNRLSDCDVSEVDFAKEVQVGKDGILLLNDLFKDFYKK